MPKNLNHDEYVAHQLRENRGGLRTTYRNAILHASVIEGLLRRRTNKKKFSQAIDALPNTIDKPQRDALHALRRARNKLVHDSFRDRYDQNDIEDLLKDVMREILNVYRISKYLNKELFNRHKIKRPREIPYQGPK